MASRKVGTRPDENNNNNNITSSSDNHDASLSRPRPRSQSQSLAPPSVNPSAPTPPSTSASVSSSGPSREVLPHPAEDLSADDDLLSWILVDQLGCMPNTKLGVHPQQVKFVGPSFKTDDVLSIVKETVTKGNIQAAMQRLQEFHLIKSHLGSKMTDAQRDRFVQHLRRYLLTLLPSSRIELHVTTRYSVITGHTELAVYATRPLESGIVMHELQGSVVPLPDQWREEMEIGEDFAVEAAGEESDSESDDDDNASVVSSAIRREKGKGKEADGKRQGQRRSDRTKRRDFSIVWSGLKRCYQLFLGPARFLNHDCNPNVELLRQGKYVTFRVCRPIRVGEELTTFYGDNYFGRSNIECLCLTCEQTQTGGFTPGSSSLATISRLSSRSGSRRDTSPNMRDSVVRDMKNPRPSSLRHEVNGGNGDEEEETASHVTAGPSCSQKSVSLKADDDKDDSNDADSEVDGELNTDTASISSRRDKPRPLTLRVSPAPTTESAASEPDSPLDPPPRRERIVRKVVQNMKPFTFLQRPKKAKSERSTEEEQSESTDEYPSDFPRCATCAKPLTEQIWFNGRYFEHCARCVRHALIFELPWPAHRLQDVQAFPPAHLVPSGYIPRRVTNVPLPTLSKAPRIIKVIEVPVSPRAETRDQRRARRLREQIEAEEFFVESLREAAWSVQEAREAAVKAQEAAAKAAAEAKIAAKLARIEEKKKKDEGKIKGSGLWNRYAYITEEEWQRRKDEKTKVLSGTRRGGQFRAQEEEEEMKRLAEEKGRAEIQVRVQQTVQHGENEEDEEAEQVAGASVHDSASTRARGSSLSAAGVADEEAPAQPVRAPRASQSKSREQEKAQEAGQDEEAIVFSDGDLCSVAALGPLVSPSTAAAESKSNSPDSPSKLFTPFRERSVSPTQVRLSISLPSQSRTTTTPSATGAPAEVKVPGANSRSVSAWRRPTSVISIGSSDMDLDADNENDSQSRSPSKSAFDPLSASGGSGLRKRGRPPGTGKRQKQAAAKLDRDPRRTSQVPSVSQSAQSTPLVRARERVSSSPDSVVCLGANLSSGKGKGKETDRDVKTPTSSWSPKKVVVPHVLGSKSGSGMKSGTFATATDLPTLSLSTQARDRRESKSPIARYLAATDSTTDSKKVDRYIASLPLPHAAISSATSASAGPTLISSYRPRKSDGSGSGTSSVEAASSALSLNSEGQSRSSDISLHTSTMSTLQNGLTKMSTTTAPLMRNIRDMSNPFQTLHALAPGPRKSHTETIMTDLAVGPTSSLSPSASTSTAALGQQSKRKRVSLSDASDASSSSQNQAQIRPEKKKRTFFPASLPVKVWTPTPVLPKPKHCL